MTDGASRRPRVLLTNDDGVRSPGLRAAYEALSAVADVTVVAPTEQKSGASHTITLGQPLRAYALGEMPGYMVEYTPVDCVKLALDSLLPGRPDLVVSGINWGSNAGNLVHYSGTVGAAIEAALVGVPALAVSLACLRCPDFGPSARVTRVLAERVLARGLPAGTVLNVNVPARPWEELKGFRWCRQSLSRLQDDYERREDPRGVPYYWLSGSLDLQGEVPDDDATALSSGYVAVVPITIDWTHRELFGRGGADYLDGLGG